LLGRRQFIVKTLEKHLLPYKQQEPVN
jgi:hypothetical protein